MYINIFTWFLLTASVLVALPVVAQEEPLTLHQAREAAAAGSFDALTARARARAAREQRWAGSAFLFPRLFAEAGAVRSDDPVAAFGARLRQGAFTQEHFDPARLNTPGPLTDWSGALGAEWAPLDPSAISGRSAATFEADAAARGAEWAVRAAVFRAEALYLGSVGATGRLNAALAALEAAEATLRRVELRVSEGSLTDADAMQARAAVQAGRTRAIEAERSLADTRERLAVALGWAPGRIPVPTDTAFTEADARIRDPGRRPDLEASALGARAAEERAREASLSRLPTVRGFARLESHAPSATSDWRSDWTAGFVVSVPLFTGFEVTARERAATAVAEASRLEHELSLRQARADVAAATRGLDAARQGARAADAAWAAAEEAARLMRLRFDEGLITTAELLSTEAIEADLRTAAVDARLGLRLASARLAFLTQTTTQDLER
jgi:outer membrane protein TolC